MHLLPLSTRCDDVPRKSKRSISLSLIVASVLLAWTGASHAQPIIHSQLVNTPNGPAVGLFEVSGGALTSRPTGLASNNFPSLSPDGRFVTISASDPAFPNEASDDLWEFDRVTGQTRKIIDNETTTQPNGSIFFASPLFSARSPNNQLVAVATQLGAVPGGGLPQQLTVHRASDGFLVGLAEIGQGAALDFTRGEFLGLDWSPDGLVFAAPAYVNVFSNTGRPTASIGIVLYGFNAATQDYDRVGTLTTPQVFDTGQTIIQENHAYPVFSPSGQRLAFFSLTFPDPLLQGAVTARLHTINTNGTNPVTVLTFSPGLFPLGLSWTPDGTQLAFSIATQASSGGSFQPLGLPETAVLRLINASGGSPTPIAGAPAGFFPNVSPVFVPEPGTGSGLLISCMALLGLARIRRSNETALRLPSRRRATPRSVDSAASAVAAAPGSGAGNASVITW